MQNRIISALENNGWTAEGTLQDGTREMTAYSFDGMINKYGYVMPDGSVTIVSDGGPVSKTAAEILSLLVEKS